MESLSKCSSIIDDDFKLQDYMLTNSFLDIREIFRIKTRMNKLKGNFPSDPKHKVDGGMACVGCGNINIKETNSHVTKCDAYADLLVGRDLACDSDLVGFFKAVMARRERKLKSTQKKNE